MGVLDIFEEPCLREVQGETRLRAPGFGSLSTNPVLKAARECQASAKFTHTNTLRDITAFPPTLFSEGTEQRANFDSAGKPDFLFSFISENSIICLLFFSLLVASKWELNSAHSLVVHSHWSLLVIFLTGLTACLSPKHTALFNPWNLCLHLISF